MRQQIEEVKKSFLIMSQLSGEQKNSALDALADLLQEKRSEILTANQRDLDENKGKIGESLYQRLILGDSKIDGLIAGTRDLRQLPDPVGRIISEKKLQENLLLQQVSVPIGVIGVIFEARPEAMVQILSLVLKSGNAAVLKGGKEARHSNECLAEIFHELSRRLDFLPDQWCVLLHSREEVHEILQYDDLIDLVIPRGSNQLVRSVMAATKIPVLGHADGICHIYVDKSFNRDFALDVIMDAKTQYPAACNAVETLLIHREIAGTFLPQLLERCRQQGVQIFGEEELKKWDASVTPPAGWAVEYSDLKMSVKLVSGLDEAVDHINLFGSHHTDAVLSEDRQVQEKFLAAVDSASVFVNVSTRYADGFRFGMGAEVGISTSKTHARGPVGLQGLVTYKFLLRGSGHTVGKP